jgi:hypothetical protein
MRPDRQVGKMTWMTNDGWSLSAHWHSAAQETFGWLATTSRVLRAQPTGRTQLCSLPSCKLRRLRVGGPGYNDLLREHLESTHSEVVRNDVLILLHFPSLSNLTVSLTVLRGRQTSPHPPSRSRSRTPDKIPVWPNDTSLLVLLFVESGHSHLRHAPPRYHPDPRTESVMIEMKTVCRLTFTVSTICWI